MGLCNSKPAETEPPTAREEVDLKSAADGDVTKDLQDKYLSTNLEVVDGDATPAYGDEIYSVVNTSQYIGKVPARRILYIPSQNRDNEKQSDESGESEEHHETSPYVCIAGDSGKVCLHPAYIGHNSHCQKAESLEESGKIHVESVHSSPITDMCYFAPMSMIFTTSRDRSIGGWKVDAAAQESPESIPDAHTLTITTIDTKRPTQCNNSNTSEDSEVQYGPVIIASGGRDTVVKVWDWERKTCVMKGKCARNIVTAVRWFPGDSSLLAQSSEELCIRVWDIRMGVLETAMEIRGAHTQIQKALDVSPCGNYIVTGSHGFGGVGCSLHIWDVRNLHSPQISLSPAERSNLSLSGHGESVNRVKWVSPQRIISCAQDGKLIIWQKGFSNDWGISDTYFLPSKPIDFCVLPPNISVCRKNCSQNLCVSAFDGNVYTFAL